MSTTYYLYEILVSIIIIRTLRERYAVNNERNRGVKSTPSHSYFPFKDLNPLFCNMHNLDYPVIEFIIKSKLNVLFIGSNERNVPIISPTFYRILICDSMTCISFICTSQAPGTLLAIPRNLHRDI